MYPEFENRYINFRLSLMFYKHWRNYYWTLRVMEFTKNTYTKVHRKSRITSSSHTFVCECVSIYHLSDINSCFLSFPYLYYKDEDLENIQENCVYKEPFSNQSEKLRISKG